MSKKSMKYIIIHVGKCSGTILDKSLRVRNSHLNNDNNKIDFDKIHHARKKKTKPIEPDNLIKNLDKYKFIFCIRHPLDRMISAFNFKFTRGIIRNGHDHFEGEIEGFKHFKTINNLGENLYNDDGTENIKAFEFCSNCDHIAYGLHHYLDNFNENYNIRVIRHEHVKEDYKEIFNEEMYTIKDNLQPNFCSKIDSKFKKVSKIEISKKAYNNLKKFLKKDMEIIERLERYNLISKEYKDFCLNKLPNNIIIID